MPYDYLILAAGAVTNYFGIEGVQQHGFPLKNLPDAIGLRNHILRVFEQVDRDPGAASEGALNFVVVVGGPTGVEMAGALVELFDVMQKDYRHVDTRAAKVYLLETQPTLLPPYAEKLRRYTRRIEGQPTEPFRYKDLGQMATIGRHAAVAEFGGVKMKGSLAWIIWAFVHIWKLVGFRNRLNVFVNWIYNYFTYDRNARLLLDVIPISDEVKHEVEDVAAEMKRQMEEMERADAET